ncbi:MAG: hypothetical protein RLY49_222 [Candidatus Parcubacteria bacterium]|jgi:hypothetical protein
MKKILVIVGIAIILIIGFLFLFNGGTKESSNNKFTEGIIDCYLPSMKDSAVGIRAEGHCISEEDLKKYRELEKDEKYRGEIMKNKFFGTQSSRYTNEEKKAVALDMKEKYPEDFTMILNEKVNIYFSLEFITRKYGLALCQDRARDDYQLGLCLNEFNSGVSLDVFNWMYSNKESLN